MKRYSGFSSILILAVILAVGLLGFLFFQNFQQKTKLTPSPAASSVCIPDDGPGSPHILNNAKDKARKDVVKYTGEFLQDYYTKNKKAPASLEELVKAGYLKEVPLDPQTNEPFTYLPNDDVHGCVIKSQLCEGGVTEAYCVK